MKTMIAALALVMTTPAVAGPVLWQNVEAGMPAAKVMELYPESKVKPKVKWAKYGVTLVDFPVGECLADVFVVTDKPMSDPASVVENVELRGYGCAGATFRSLAGKYGEPTDNRNGHERDAVFGGETDTRDAIWTDAGRTIHFTSERGGIVSNWRLKYEPVKDIGL